MREWVEGLYDSYKDGIYSFIAGMTGDRHAAEDLTQEAFARAMAAAKGFEARALPKTWLFAIARNLALSHIASRRRRRNEEPGALDGFAADDASPSGMIEAKETSKALVLAVQGLTAAHREVFLMKTIDGMTYREIAETIGCPVGTAQSRFHYAVKELRRALSRQGVE